MNLETQRAAFSLIEACLPGDSPQAVGVVVLVPETGEWRVRFRRDWDTFGEEAEVLEAVASDFEDKLREMGAEQWLAQCEESWSHTLRITDREAIVSANLDATLRRLYDNSVRPKVIPFRTHLPLYPVRIAAGAFLDGEEAHVEEWVEVPPRMPLEEGMFLARITGHSMELRIPDGSICLFRQYTGGSRQGKLLLIERLDVPEEIGRYTVKRYHSEKRVTGDEWEHTRIRLEPLNPEFEAWDLDASQFRTIAEFVQVIE